jgi:hypothetical protein
MGRACSTHGILVGKPEGKRQLDVDRRIILILTLEM